MEIKNLKNGQNDDFNSRLSSLNSFLDNQDIVRVGGRL